MGRTNVEQRLKRDINEKNVAARALRRRMHEAAKYRRQGDTTANRRWKKRYAETAARLSEIARADADALLKISEDEVREFQKRYEKELSEHAEAQKRSKTAQEDWVIAERSWKSASKEQREKLRAIEAEAARSRTQARKEEKDVDKAAREVQSEARDKAFLALELERIASERARFKR